MKKMLAIVIGAIMILTLPTAAAEKTDFYTALKVTGSGFDMEQVYSMGDLLELAGYAEEKSELEGLLITETLDSQEVTGLAMGRLLSLCGSDSEEAEIVVIADGSVMPVGVDSVLIVLVDGEIPVEGAGVIVNGEMISGVDEILIGEDMHYEMHNRAPHDISAEITFTFNIYKDGELSETVVMTTSDLENLAIEHPEAVYGSWYGIMGNKEDVEALGTGGYLDYYEGLRFDYLLEDVLGISELKGHADLYGREGKIYSSIDDLGYFNGETEDYYMCTSDGDVILGKAMPVLAYAKNGSPLLPDHEHDVDGYVRNTPLKSCLKDLGIEEVNLGTVKNHSGPFVAALGNYDDFYGGYQVETSADCVQMDIYLD